MENAKNCIEISGRFIGEDYPPLVIPEIGINHEGKLETAFEMVDATCRAGAEIVKHQTHVVDDEMSKAAKKVIPGNSNDSIYDIMTRCSLSETEEIELKRYVETKGMIYLSTPFSREAANRLEKMNVVAYKIGSGECNNYPLVEHIATFGKPIILSTGMNDLASIDKAVVILRKYKVPFALLHTTNLYPTPSHLVRLGAMVELQNKYCDSIVGLSDHTTSNLACFAATALGASILERHFTDRSDRPGPDIANSMNEGDLKELLNGSHKIWQMRGGHKQPTQEESVTINFAFATVVSVCNIKAGEVLTKENIWVKRPGTGEIKAEYYNKILGKKLKRNIEKDEHLAWSDID